MNFKTIIFLLLLTGVSACGDDNGHRVLGENLTVYYLDSEDQKLAEDLAIFWRDNDLLSNNKQDIQLVKDDSGYQVRIIAFNPKEVNAMPLEERALLLDLQKQLNDSLFQNDAELVICNSKFKPIYSINQ